MNALELDNVQGSCEYVDEDGSCTDAVDDAVVDGNEDDIDERASILIKMRSLEPGQHHHHLQGGSVTVPPPERGSVRVDLDG